MVISSVHLKLQIKDHVYERSFPIYEGVPDYTMQVHDGIHSFVRPNKTMHLLVGTAGIDLGSFLS